VSAQSGAVSTIDITYDTAGRVTKEKVTSGGSSDLREGLYL